MLHTTFSRKGGKASSPAKTLANRRKAAAFWKSVRARKVPTPRRHRAPPLLANGGLQADSVTFADNPGLKFFSMEAEMAKILGVPVHLLSRDSLDEMTNPYRRASILADARVLISV